MTYPKVQSSSALRVIAHMSVRAHKDAANGCHHWYLTFNDATCSNPGTIEMMDHRAFADDYYRNIDRE
ncbi:hypothetical protein EB796_007680 [Bugula neritina]|uniref:CTHRC1 C-terminal domain-containing protein n=1 Tax=Bugula neritina TaxID=10212 RepID=A0A7J7K5T0_BUGNE|nr:hypothetical protein EB796_008441 [Bugula neritina]KAF6034012.1 hypothetical protein EB796_007680 [Bugula neritina]